MACFALVQIRMQDAVQAAAAAEERRIRADNYRATLLANMQLAEARAARDAADRQSELLRSEAELSATLADPYLGEDPAMAASSLSAYRFVSTARSHASDIHDLAALKDCGTHPPDALTAHSQCCSPYFAA